MALPSHNRRRWLTFAIAGGGLAVGLLGLAFGLHGGGSAETAAIAPIQPAPIMPSSPPVPQDRLLEKVPVSLDADVPSARVTFRRRVLAAPTTAKVTLSDVVELIEVSARATGPCATGSPSIARPGSSRG